MEENSQNLESEIKIIKERNARVEIDKAWETSRFRIFSIAVITYIVAIFVLYFIGANNPLLSALVPTIGFLLSVQTMPIIKKWWITKYLSSKMNNQNMPPR